MLYLLEGGPAYTSSIRTSAPGSMLHHGTAICPGPGEKVVEALFAAVNTFRAGWPSGDDATALAITVR